MNQNNQIPKLRFPEFSDAWKNKKLFKTNCKRIYTNHYN